MSRYELSISTSYVPTWTYVEAVRELFQNALDNETENPENTMLFEYSDEKLFICNKHSSLTKNTLLIGSSSKRGNDDTIGQHGEGYKIAFMVLLREGKTITVYNYGLKEVWTARIVKSRLYGEDVVQIETKSKPIWEKIPNHDLTIEVGGISEEEYAAIVKSNLHLKKDVTSYYDGIYGGVLTDESEKGRIYVKGLFVCEKTGFQYGYDFYPKVIKLDRDRKLVDSFDVQWYSSSIWSKIINDEHKFGADVVGDLRKKALVMLNNDKPDVRYIGKRSYFNDDILELFYGDFRDKYGDDAIPVMSQVDMESANKTGYKPVLVNESLGGVLKLTKEVEAMYKAVDSNENRVATLFEKLTEFKDATYEYLEDEHYEMLKSIIDYVEAKLL